MSHALIHLSRNVLYHIFIRISWNYLFQYVIWCGYYSRVVTIQNGKNLVSETIISDSRIIRFLIHCLFSSFVYQPLLCAVTTQWVRELSNWTYTSFHCWLTRRCVVFSTRRGHHRLAHRTSCRLYYWANWRHVDLMYLYNNGVMCRKGEILATPGSTHGWLH